MVSDPSTISPSRGPGRASAVTTALSCPGNVPVVVVVGFDGSEPAQRALDSAAWLLHDRSGWLEVVFVAHAPASAPMYPTALGELERSFDDLERQLHDDVAARLESAQPLWHFRRRDGLVGHELIAVADDLRRQNPDAAVVLVVGGASHKYHRVLGSVSSRLERADRFPVLVVP